MKDSQLADTTALISQYQNIHNYISNSRSNPIVSDFDTKGGKVNMKYHLPDVRHFFDDNYSLRTVYYLKNKKSKAVVLRKIWSNEYDFMAYFRGHYILTFESRSHLIACWIDNIKKTVSYIQENK